MKIMIVFFAIVSSVFSLFSQPYFQKVTTGQIATDISSSSMCAWGDYNDDGFQDLVVIPWNDDCWPCSYPILLYKNNGNGTFTRDINAIGQEVIYGNGAAWGDYDNDGKIDLIITRDLNSTNLLFHNDGNGQFTKITTGIIVTEVGSSVGCSWSDYDRDGWLDLFIAHAQGQKNCLYHNNHDGTFTKITSGNIVNDIGDSRGCAWGDYDNDGWPDLYVVNYSSLNCFLYHNNGNGTFTKITSGPEVTTAGNGSSCSWADFDNDGLLDLYVTYNSSNNRLYHNDGNGNFSLSGTLPSFENGYSYVANWSDFDNDGWIDLFVPKRNEGGLQNQKNSLFKNVDGTGFVKVTNDVIGAEGGASDAGAWGDFNNDGKMDIYVGNGSVSPLISGYFYKNITSTGNYITFKLKGCLLNKSAIGSRIKIKSGNYTAIREISGGNASQNMLWQHFGLGSITNLDSVIVTWTTGTISRLANIPVNQFLTIEECPIGIINNQTPVKYELKQNYPNPFNPNTKIEYSLIKTGNVKLTVYDITGKLIQILVDEIESQGTYQINFYADNLASGTYVYKFETDEFTDIKKMVIIK